MTRVVVPAYSAGRTIHDCIRAILASDIGNVIEIIVVDDGGHIDLPAFLAGLPVKVISSGGTGSAAAARNCGATGFDGRYLVFIDADVLVHRQCLARLIEPLERGLAEASVGNYSCNVTGLSFAARYKQLYIASIYRRRTGYLRNDFWTAIGAVDATLFQTAGGFDPRFRGACGEDGELGVRLTRYGARIVGVPDAVGDHRHIQSLRGLLVNDWRKGRVALHNRFLSGSTGAMSDNQHATHRNKAAVLLAMALATLPAWALALSIPAATAALFAAGLTMLHLGVRAEVMRSFISEGAWFAARAVPVMIMLDLVRICCVATAYGGRASDRVMSPELRAILPRRLSLAGKLRRNQ